MLTPPPLSLLRRSGAVYAIARLGIRVLFVSGPMLQATLDERARKSTWECYFGFVVEKNPDLPKGDPRRKFKGRAVFQGNNVVNQNWEAAMFQDLGNALATMEASRIADCYGCFPQHDCQQSDAEQAYIQAPLKGTDTWVALPPDQWPKAWSGRSRPVCRLLRALYGHPDSGT